MLKKVSPDPLAGALKVSGNKNKTKSSDTAPFGVHIMIDGYGGDPKLLNNMSLVFQALHELPEKIKMHKMMPPYVVWAPPISEKDSGGYSGFVMIAESHISVHTFPKKKFVSIDVYTCKSKLPTDYVIDYFKKMFRLKTVEAQVVKRASMFPKNDLV